MELVVSNESRELTADDVFTHWKDVTAKPRARMDAKRRKIIADRFKDGYSYEDMQDAISGNFLDPWSQGENERNTVYNDIGLILRDAEHVDRFIEIYESAQERCRNLTISKVSEGKPPADREYARQRLEAIRRQLR